MQLTHRDEWQWNNEDLTVVWSNVLAAADKLCQT